MKDYEATVEPCRSPYGVELDIAVPESRFPIIVAQDVYGEVAERLQVLVYPAGEGPEVEESVGVRFNPDGTIAEVCVPCDVSVAKWDAPEPTSWLRERDGA
ncbi:hypothetical protein PDESU_00946 [Pontiella desulfatans]|uniref:Uncharacterized protein n=1 Tax=Pontiella desulfatans TaxID=2750659 RepID=A0A6C2TY65_PONDE|nr:hypothetical protein [Pontiella desulfatans]VGO12394.1 hypothetical protein PDESU_00946 [Pontiella desulfatans]